MLVYTNKKCSIFFGNASDEFFPEDIKPQIIDSKQILTLKPFQQLNQTLNPDSLIFLEQTHSSVGYAITNAMESPFSLKGDFLSTKLNVGIGVLTADCLPVIIYDAANEALAAVHAGWRGSVNSILDQSLKHMKNIYNSKIENLEIFFGPSAKSCCYEVGSDFITHLKAFSFADKTLNRRNGKVYFDLPQFNQEVLMHSGISQNQICNDYNECTICNTAYCSYRRQGSAAGRQITVACLNIKKK